MDGESDSRLELLVGENDSRYSRLPVLDSEVEFSLGVETRLCGIFELPDLSGEEFSKSLVEIRREGESLLEMDTGIPSPNGEAFWRFTNHSGSGVEVSLFTCQREGLLVSDGRSKLNLSSEGPTEKDVALSLYFLARELSVHGPPPVFSWVDGEIINPHRFFTALGYGLCGHVAHAFCALCGLNGLRARVVAIGGHTFPEVFFEGKWHILDPNGETWFPESGRPQGYLSLEEVSELGEEYWSGAHFRPMGRGKRFSDLSRNYRNRELHRCVWENQGTDRKEMGGQRLGIAPGERVVFWAAGSSPGQVSERHQPWWPPFYPPRNAGLLVRERVIGAADVNWRMTERAGKCLEVPIDRAWPLIDVLVEGEPGLAVYLAFGEECMGPFEPVKGGERNSRFRLRRGIQGRDGPPDSLLLGGVSEPVTLTMFHQYNCRGFPFPKRRRCSIDIDVSRQDGTEGGLSVDVEFGFNHESGCGDDAVVPDQLGMELMNDQILFRWVYPHVEGIDNVFVPHEIELAGEVITPACFEFVACYEKRVASIVHPALHVFLQTNRFRVEEERMRKMVGGTRFFWRVRRVDSRKRAISAWSEWASGDLDFPGNIE